MFKLFKRQPKPDVIEFRPNFYANMDTCWTASRCVGCGDKVWSALFVNGACIPCCGHVDCNRKAIAQRKASCTF